MNVRITMRMSMNTDCLLALFGANCTPTFKGKKIYVCLCLLLSLLNAAL